MLTMTAPKKPRPKSTPKRDNGVPVLYVRISPELEAAIQSFIAAQRVAPERTAVTIKALEEFLQREGFWPPKT